MVPLRKVWLLAPPLLQRSIRWLEVFNKLKLDNFRAIVIKDKNNENSVHMNVD